MADDIINVAYVDDHNYMRIGVETAIRSDPSLRLVFHCPTGMEMIRFLHQSEQLPDVCLIDISMPEMDGVEVQSQIKNYWPDIKTLAYTMHDENSHILRMLSAGADGYLLKGLDDAELITAIKKVYSFGYYSSRMVSIRMIRAVRNNEIKLPHLTDKEIQFLKLVATEITYYKIADLMETSFKSVEGIRDRLLQKLNLKNRIGLVLFAIEQGYGRLRQTPFSSL